MIFKETAKSGPGSAVFF